MQEPAVLDSRLLVVENQLEKSTLEKVNDPFLKAAGVHLWMKRDDRLHPIISGNKWRKLKYIVEHALSLQPRCLISMGGQYSNHLHALAFVGKQLGLPTVAWIRGDPPLELNRTLKDLADWGMELHFISRSEYRELRKIKDYDGLPEKYGTGYWLSEGGANPLALKGVAELVGEISEPCDYFCLPCGTGTTLAGIASTVTGDFTVLGFVAFKGGAYLKDEISALLPHQVARQSWQLNLDYHFGGFAKTSPQLLAFVDDFSATTGIMIEPTYTGKMLYGIYDLVKQNYFKKGQSIIALHTGGLQSIRAPR